MRQLTEERIQYTILVPAMLNMIVKLPNVDELDLSSIRTITTGSAPPLGLVHAGVQASLGH
jgi:acyl-CoA synthetase (AMP-forming)/AMP-acid ligase II